MKEFGPGNNGIFATKDIKEGELIMYIPREMILTLDEAQHSKTFEKLVEKKALGKLELSQSNLMFKLFMMEERRNPDSMWAHYLAVVPNDWSAFPPLYSDEELIDLDGSFFIRSVREFRKAMSREYSVIAKKIPGFADTYPY